MATKSTRMSSRIKETMLQYSKKMCTRVTIFWMLYRLANFIVVLIRQEIADALVDLSTGIDTVMLINMGFYSTNSISEKICTAYISRKSLYANKSISIDTNANNATEDEENDNG